jgi:hypothetical protein
MKELDASKLGWITRLPAGPPGKDALARIVDADGGRDDTENSYYEAAGDPSFVGVETAQRRFRGQYLRRLRGLSKPLSQVGVDQYATSASSRKAHARRSGCDRSSSVVDGRPAADGVMVAGMTAQPVGPDPREPYQVIHLGGQAAAIVPLADLRRLQAVERLAPAEVVELSSASA